eukprot:365939-Chlamydomonas_euryale.AAC.14
MEPRAAAATSRRTCMWGANSAGWGVDRPGTSVDGAVGCGHVTKDLHVEGKKRLGGVRLAG